MIPTEKELLEFIAKREFVNFSIIAKFFEIKNTTASDLVQDLVKTKKVKVFKIGGSKMVRLVK